VLLSIGYYGFMGMGMMSAGLWWTFGVIGLVNLLIAAWIGARLYTEDGPAV